MTSLIWKSIPISRNEISLARVLRCGQAFRWKNIDGIWSCTLKGRIVFLRQDDHELHYSSLWPAEKRIGTKDNSSDDTLALITDYLNLNVKVLDLYEQWSLKDKNFQKHAQTFAGIRILRQDPWENLVSFICSTNNNVKRISQMCENLCVHFGRYINTYKDIKYYDFPLPQALAADSNVEQRLRDLNFGYRAKYIHVTAKQIAFDPEGLKTLYNLRDKDYKTAHSELLKFTGVGPKVADCVCLMSLDKHDVVPIDTHVWTIAQRDYKFKTSFKSKTLSQNMYAEAGDFFRALWGTYAGWAHSVLFAADLSDLNNGVNVANGVHQRAESKKKAVVKKENGKVEVDNKESVFLTGQDNEDEKIVVKEEDTVIYSTSGRPLRGKRRLQVLNEQKEQNENGIRKKKMKKSKKG